MDTAICDGVLFPGTGFCGWKWLDLWMGVGILTIVLWLEMAGCMAENMIQTDSLTITPEMLVLIAELDEFKGRWQALATLAPDRLASLRKVATIESIGSSTRIEGSHLSDREVEQLLGRLEIKAFASRDAQEVAGYSDVMETVFTSWSVLTLTENHIKQLHRDLLRYVDKDERHRGEYKKLDNHVEAFDASGKSLGIVFETASPFETPGRMAELIDWTRVAETQGELHTLLVISIFVVVFLAIHPFQDGNGRLSRILTTLLLLRSGYAYVPYASLESVIEQSKSNYYMALRRTQKTIRTNSPDWHSWVLYFLRSLQQQKRQLAGKMDHERKVLGALPALSLQIVELARQRGKIKVVDVINVTAAPRGTIKDHIAALVRNGHLAKHGTGKGTWYSLP